MPVLEPCRTDQKLNERSIAELSFNLKVMQRHKILSMRENHTIYPLRDMPIFEHRRTLVLSARGTAIGIRKLGDVTSMPDI